MRLLLDTNVLVAAFIARGACAELAEAALAGHQVVSSEALLREFQTTLTGKFKIAPERAAEAAALLRSRVQLVEPDLPQPPLCRDPDDDLVLGAAAAGTCRCLVTGDKDLLVLGEYRGVAIIPPRLFWAQAAAEELEPD